MHMTINSVQETLGLKHAPNMLIYCYFAQCVGFVSRPHPVIQGTGTIRIDSATCQKKTPPKRGIEEGASDVTYTKASAVFSSSSNSACGVRSPNSSR